MIPALLLAVTAGPLSLHIHVDGSGYFRFAKSADLMYSSDATLLVKDGILETSDGAIIIPRIHVPTNCSKLGVSLDGHVTAVTPQGASTLGQIVLSMLSDDSPHVGLFKSSLRGTLSSPGDGLAGVIRCSSTAKSATKSQPVSSGPIKIVVRQMSEVDNDTLTLGDIATFSGDKDRRGEAQVIELGRTPVLGQSIRFSEGYIATKLKLAGFKADDYELIVPESATVTRPTQVVTTAQMIETAVNAIKEHYDVTVDLKPDAAIPDLKVPKGDLVLTAELGAKTDRSINILVMAEIDGKRVGSRSITMIPTQDASGVKIGDQVTIRLLSAGATVEITGHAKSAGWVGQSVTVQSDTGSIHTAKVISSSLVEVQL